MGSPSCFIHQVTFDCCASCSSNLSGLLYKDHSKTSVRDFIRCCTNKTSMSQWMDFHWYQWDLVLPENWDREREWAEMNFLTCRIQLLKRKCNFSRAEGVGAASEQLWGKNILWNTCMKISHGNYTRQSSVWESL